MIGLGLRFQSVGSLVVSSHVFLPKKRFAWYQYGLFDLMVKRGV
jgi:hypothetical protein